MDITLVAKESTVAAGSVVQVDVFAADFTDLRGYQVAVDITGGQTGKFAWDDIGIDMSRPDFVFTGLETRIAMDKVNSRLACLLPSGSVASKPSVYLCTFQFRASRDASGTFTITLRTGNGTLVGDSTGQPIDAILGSAMTISVESSG